MASALHKMVHQLQAFLAEVDPQRVTTVQAAQVVEDLCHIERLATAGKLLFASRAAGSTAVTDQGHTTPAYWLAELTKTSVGDAISTLETSRSLAELPETAEALRSGTLSGAQAKEVTRAATKDPTSERELLALAETDSLKGLQSRARQVLAQSASQEEEEARARAIFQKRSLRHYLDHEGFLRLDARLPAEAGARVVSSIQAEADAIFRQARLDENPESPQAYRADALVALVTSRAQTGRAGANAHRGRSGARTDTLVLRVDAAAARRGYVKNGEMCEIAGIGPTPVATVRRIWPEAFVKGVIRDSKDVRSICHFGRAVSAHQQTALEERDPTCVWPSCSVAVGLENHHFVRDYARCGTTSLDNLARVCARHHDMITYGGFVLEGGPGQWRFRAPPDSEDDRGQRLRDTG